MAGNKRVFMTMAGVHFALIFGLIFAGMLKGCLPKKEKPKIIAVVSIDPISVAPTPPTPTPPTPEPPPPEPEPEKPPPEPEKPAEPVKPKYKAKTPEEIRKTIKKNKIVRKVEKPPPVKPPDPKKLITKDDLRSLVDPVMPTNPRTPRVNSAQTEQAMNDVLLDLQRKAYAAWDKPEGLKSTAHVTFRVNRFGKVLSCVVSQPSGYTLMDQSVLGAGQKIKTIRRFPTDFVGDSEEFTIIFHLTE